MNTDIFQIIYSEIRTFIPEKFEKIVFYGENSTEHYCYEFFVLIDNEKWLKCYDIQNVDFEDLLKTFDAIDNVVNELKTSNPVENNWDIITITIDRDLKFHADYVYKDSQFDKLIFESEWKNKYLN